jgi:hypothetical protein
MKDSPILANFILANFSYSRAEFLAEYFLRKKERRKRRKEREGRGKGRGAGTS